jgi:hypothetical protein
MTYQQTAEQKLIALFLHAVSTSILFQLRCHRVKQLFADQCGDANRFLFLGKRWAGDLRASRYGRPTASRS